VEGFRISSNAVTGPIQSNNTNNNLHMQGFSMSSIAADQHKASNNINIIFQGFGGIQLEIIRI